MEVESLQENKIFHLLFCSPDAHNGPDWARSKPGAGHSVQVSTVGSRHKYSAAP